MDPQAPPVVAVVVAADSGGWLEETLTGLAAQDYPNLSVLVVDSGSREDPTGRIADVLPSAYVRRLPRPVGYAAAANQAIEAVEGASFFLMCHDDVVLDADAVRLLVEEAFRSNAGVVGPKLVSWEDPGRLLQVGMGADRSGVQMPIAQPGELDQEQHDAVRDVFVAPGAAVLVRSDLFTALGGFDPSVVLFGEDLDLCWRAQVAGARVIVAPAARARHLAAASSGQRELQDLPDAPPAPSRRLALRRRHELRAVLKNYGRWHLVRVLPLVVLHSLVETAAALATGHPSAARATLGAWMWNLRRAGELRHGRRQVRSLRSLPDHEVRALQSRGSARLSSLAELLAVKASAQLHLDHDDQIHAVGQSRPWWGIGVGMTLTLFWLIGSRNLFGGGVPAVGQMVPFGSTAHLLGGFADSVQPTGLGQVAPAPLALALAGVTSVVLGFSAGLAQTLLVAGTLPIGALGAYLLARPLASTRARLMAPVVYLALPLPYAAFGRGRWGELVAYGLAPWILRELVEATGAEPFGPGSRPDAGAPDGGRALRSRRWPGWARLALLTALGGAVVPGLALVVVLSGLVLTVVGTGTWRRRAAPLLASGAGVIGAWLLAFPWSAGLVSPAGQLSAVLGVAPAPAQSPGVGSLLAFLPAPGGSRWLGWILLGAMGLPLVLGRQWRLEWSVRLWWVALAAWFLAWSGDRGWLGSWTLDPGLLVAMAAAALTLSAALGVAAFENDLVGYGLGWRQLLSLLAAAGAGLAVVGSVGHAAGGRWGEPATDLRSVASAVTGPGPGSQTGYQILWVGDPRVLPGAGWRYAPGTAYLTTQAGSYPLVAYEWPPSSPGPAAAAALALHQAQSGATGLVGRPLSRLGIRYVILPVSLAPGGPALGATPGLVAALQRQLDLSPVQLDPSVVVFQNRDWSPRRGASRPRPAGWWRVGQLLLATLLWSAVLVLVWAGRRRPVTTGAVRSAIGGRAPSAEATPIAWDES